MGRFFKKKSNSSSPASLSPRSPREQLGSSASKEENMDEQLSAANPNASPLPGAVKGTSLNKSNSMPVKASRSSSLGRGTGTTGADSGIFSEKLQQLRARLQSVVQGVRDVAQSLDEPHSLIANVADQLQTRQEAAAARRSSTSHRDATSTSACGGGATLSRTSVGSIDSSRGGRASPFAPLAAAAAAAAAEADVPPAAVDGAATVDAAGLSVKARVAAVEQRGRSGGGGSAGGGLSDTLPTVPEIHVSMGDAIQTDGAALATAASVEESSPCAAAAAAHTAPTGALAASRSFDSGRRATAEAPGDVAAAASASIGGPDVLRPSSTSSRPTSGTWPRVVIPPAVISPSSYPSTVAAAAAAAPLGARSHRISDDDLSAAGGSGGGSHAASSAGAVDAVALAALAAADGIVADAAELLRAGDDGLLAAMANPAAAVAYLREHPETLRELWTLRARVAVQEGDMTMMVKQLSSKNAQLDQAQSSLVVKERELGAITQRLTAVLAKLQTFQAAHSPAAAQGPRAPQEAAATQQQREDRGQGGQELHQSQAHEQPGRGERSAAGGGGAAGDLTPRASPAPALPVADAEGASPGCAVGGAEPSALSSSSTPQTPLRSVAAATPSSSASPSAAAVKRLFAEQEALAAAAPPPSPAARGGARPPRHMEAPATALADGPTEALAAAVDASASSSPDRQQPQAPLRSGGGGEGSLELYMPPPPHPQKQLGAAAAPALAAAGSDSRRDAAEGDAIAPGMCASPAPAAVAEEVGAAVEEARPEVVREISSLQFRVAEQEGNLAAMGCELDIRSSELHRTQGVLAERERQLADAHQQLDEALAQLRTLQAVASREAAAATRSSSPSSPNQQQKREGDRERVWPETVRPVPEAAAWQRGPAPAPPVSVAGLVPVVSSQLRPLRGLLRAVLLHVAPSVVCVGLLLRDSAGQGRTQQPPRSAAAPAATRTQLQGQEQQPAAPPPPVPQLPRPLQELLQPQSPRLAATQQQPQQQELQEEEAVGRLARARRRVMRAVAAAAAAAGVRPAGTRRSSSRRVSPVVGVAPNVPALSTLNDAGAADGDDPHSRARLECKSQWCKIIRPPPREVVYY